MKNSTKFCIYFDKFVQIMTVKIKIAFTIDTAFYFDEL